MRVVFMGTPAFAVPSLVSLVQNQFDVAAVFTQPDRASGRGNRVQFSPVKQAAVKMNIPVFQPEKIRMDGLDALRSLRPDVCVTAAFGQILSKEILEIPSMGTVNVHASLLPKYRGSSPIVWCLLNGEKGTGVTTMMTDIGIDTGDILLKTERKILREDTAESLTAKLAQDGASLLIETLNRMKEGNCPRIKQQESEMSYYPMIKKEMGVLDFSKSAEALYNQIRAFNPWPGSFFYTQEDAVLKVWSAETVNMQASAGEIICADAKNGLRIGTGDGALQILEIQAQGGKRMNAKDYLRGHEIHFVRGKA